MPEDPEQMDKWNSKKTDMGAGPESGNGEFV